MDPWILAPAEHGPSLEWPGSDIDSGSEAPSRSLPSTSHRQICLRLVVKSSEVLARKKRVAVLDAYDEAQIGRDASTSEDVPRIRLKDMEVSKVHATLFWDLRRKEWAVVDMGSKHGTFVKSGPRQILPVSQRDGQTTGDGAWDLNANSLDPVFARLSPPRQASMPRTLQNSDELAIGRTTFVVHVHLTGIPCDNCSSNGEFDIPLFSAAGGPRTQKQSVVVGEEISRASLDAKSAITLLKRSLLSRHPAPSKPQDGASQSYIDRSAKRRALHPYSPSSSPHIGIPSRSPTNLATSTVNGVLADTYRAPSASSSDTSFAYDLKGSSSISVPPAPISDANVGHRLLEKQGWVPGSTLGVPAPRSSNTSDEEERPPGDERMALSEPLQLSANLGRKGLGMRTETASPVATGSAPIVAVGDWRAGSRRRRWDELRRSVK